MNFFKTICFCTFTGGALLSLNISGAIAQQSDVVGSEYAYRGDDKPKITEGKVAGDRAFMMLGGMWNFSLDENKQGVEQKWFEKRLPDKIKLPGSVQEGGFGKDFTSVTLRSLNPVKTYVGPAWYQREVEIPENWKDKRVVFSLERVLGETRVWVDNAPAGCRRRVECHAESHRVDSKEQKVAEGNGYGKDEGAGL